MSALLADDATGFLPSDMPSQQALALLRSEFPDHAPASRAVVVCARDTGLMDNDRAWVAALSHTLQSRTAELGWRVQSSTIVPHLSRLLESGDGAAAIVTVDLPAEMLTHSTVNRVREIQQAVSANPPPGDLKVEITGTGALGELLDANAKGDVEATSIWAFMGVTVILLIIYRSPVAMFLPMVTITLALMLSLGLLGRAAAGGLPINGLVEMFVIVILAGTGVDYCLFLFARYREELSANGDTKHAVRAALSKSGGAILASAGTNVAGLGTLALAHNRDMYTTGPTIAVAIVLGTLAVLTLTPALMCLVGRKLVWPTRADRLGRDSVLWTSVADLATRRPLAVVAALLVVMLPPAMAALQLEPFYDSLDEYPAESSFVRGARLYEKHFQEGKPLSEQTALLTFAERIDGPDSADKIVNLVDAVYKTLAEKWHLCYQRDLHDPLGLDRPDKRNDDDVNAIDVRRVLAKRFARPYYLGKSGKTLRIDVGIQAEPRAVATLDDEPRLRKLIESAIADTSLAKELGTAPAVHLAGQAATYADIRNVRRGDFRIIAVAAIALIYVILLALLRDPWQACLLVAATLITYLFTYGITWQIFRFFYGVGSLSYQLDFILFIIILSLGQDYNIYVVSRIREERSRREMTDAVRVAVTKTGRVVSSCGLIMAAAFASMMSGSLLVMKEFAVALALGILIDTFLVRPLLVPAAILLTTRNDNSKS